VRVPLATQESHFSMQSVSPFQLFHRFGGLIFEGCLVNDTPDVRNGIEIRRVRWSAILGYKVWQILLTPSELPLKYEPVLHPEQMSSLSLS